MRITFGLALATFLFFPALALAQDGEVIAREGKGSLERLPDGQLVLRLRGSPYEMGFQHGRLVGDLAKANMDKIVNNKGPFGKRPEYTLYQLMRGDMHDQLRPHIPPRFLEEMRGLSDGAGVDYADIEAGNLFPAAFHCSGIALKGKATKDGELYHVRILDYMTQLGLQDQALVIIHEPDGMTPWLNVGFAGFIGSVTGMNAQQVAIGEMGGRGLGYWNGVPMPLLIRDALERASSLEEAVAIFETSKRTCEYYYVISDGKSQDARGLWTTPEVCEVVRMGESFGLLENLRPHKGAAGGKAFARGVTVDAKPHSVLFKAEGKVTGFLALPPEDTLVLSGPDRYRCFMDRLTPRYGEVDEQVLMELVKRPVSMKSNLHVAIFHPEPLEVWVAVAASDGSPACDQPYYRYSLAPSADDGAK